jgi:hypothetical protein
MVPSPLLIAGAFFFDASVSNVQAGACVFRLDRKDQGFLGGQSFSSDIPSGQQTGFSR